MLRLPQDPGVAIHPRRKRINPDARWPRGGVATQRTANPCTGVRFPPRPPSYSESWTLKVSAPPGSVWVLPAFCLNGRRDPFRFVSNVEFFDPQAGGECLGRRATGRQTGVADGRQYHGAVHQCCCLRRHRRRARHPPAELARCLSANSRKNRPERLDCRHASFGSLGEEHRDGASHHRPLSGRESAPVRLGRARR